MKILLKNCRPVTGGEVLELSDVLTENGKILAVNSAGMLYGDNSLDLQGNYLAPGFIDLHCHGAGGYEFIDADEDSFRQICRIHARHGARVLYPTISATDFETIVRCLETAERVMGDCDLEIPGIHLEGPYLAPEMCGAQDPYYIKAPDAREYEPVLERFGHIIARWTYAPERDDGSFLRAMAEHGVTPSMGHSAAEYSHVLGALEGGCRLITHMYSCMSTITRHGGFRRLGIIESAYLLDDLYAEAIADGCHIPAELLRLLVKIKGTDRVCLITDAIRYAGMSASENLAGGTERIPYVIEDGVAKLSDRSAFAGSIATADVLLKRTVEAGIPLADTVRMLTQTPAQAMGLKTKGCIAPGYDAQFTVFNAELNVRDLSEFGEI